MAYTTTDVRLRPEDGWTLVATNPTALIVKPDVYAPWYWAVTSGSAPAAGVEGVLMGRGDDSRREALQTGAITGTVYIRVRDVSASEPVSQTTRFAVVKDA